METAERVAGIIAALKEEYPDPVCALQYRKDYELMIAVRLSAQCTDARVNLVTPALFARYPTLDAFAEADVAEVETYVHSCGFYKHKAEDIVLACRMLRDEYGGKVPDTMDALLRLPGVGRKTANLLLGDIYKRPGSVVCDTHCIRICNLLGLASGKEPAKVEQQLRAILPPEGIVRLLPPDRAARPRRLRRAQARLRPLLPRPLLQKLLRKLTGSMQNRPPF